MSEELKDTLASKLNETEIEIKEE